MSFSEHKFVNRTPSPTGRRITYLVAATTIAILLSACSSVYVADKQRTAIPGFDGIWHGEINAKETAFYGPVIDTLYCPSMQTVVKLDIRDGVLTGVFENIGFTANLNDKGRFYADVPKQSSYLLNGRSRFAAREYHVFKGILDAENHRGLGWYRDALGQIGEGGCEYEIVFRQSPLAPNGSAIDVIE